MKTARTLFLVIVLGLSINLSAQDTSKVFYLPHQTGDMWEYRYSEYDPRYVKTVQNFTISDSVDAEGSIYITQHARTINPISGPYLLIDTMYYKIDSTNVYGTYFGNYAIELVYKLDAQKGDQWVIKTNHSSYDIARVEDIWADTVLGKATTCMNIFYYTSSDSSDTTGWGIYLDTIADSIGLIFTTATEYMGELHLIGAVIGGKMYGDTTVVSVRNRENDLSDTFILNQNYPNPFNPSTTISFEIPESITISLIIYDVLGREVKRLIDDKKLTMGTHEVVWDGRRESGGEVSSGIYFYRLISKDYSVCRSMVFLK